MLELAMDVTIEDIYLEVLDDDELEPIVGHENLK